MFTALVVTRYLLYAFYALGLKAEKFYGVGKERKTLNLLSKKGIFFGISLALALAGFVVMGVYKKQHACSDKGGDISVDNGGERLVKTGLYGIAHGFSRRQLWLSRTAMPRSLPWSPTRGLRAWLPPSASAA